MPEVTPTASPTASAPTAKPTENLSAAEKEVLATTTATESDESESTEESTTAEEKKAEVAKKAWKLKVGGKDVTIDDEEELVRRAQMGFSADQKWQEAASLKKEIEQFVGLLQKDPYDALSALGLDVDKFAEEHINKRIEEMQKSPEQLASEKLQKELEKLKKEKEEMEESGRQAEMGRLQEQYAVQIENDISEVLKDSPDLPKTPYVVKRLADYMIMAVKAGKPDIKVSEVWPAVKKQMKKELKEMFATMPEDVVEAVIGKDVFEKVRKKRIKSLKTAPETANTVKSTGAAETKAAESKSKDKVSARDFFKNLGSR